MKQSEPAGENRRSMTRALLARPEWVLLLCLFSVAPFLLTFWVHGDGIGYVAYLRSAVVERNLDLSDEACPRGSSPAARTSPASIRPSTRRKRIRSPDGSPPTSAWARPSPGLPRTSPRTE
jgi:hypothetical protein